MDTSRLDVTDSTATTHTVNLRRILDSLGDRHAGEITAGDVATLVANLHERGLARESIRKTVSTLAQTLDFSGVKPNPARDRRTVKLPRRSRGRVPADCRPRRGSDQAPSKGVPAACRRTRCDRAARERTRAAALGRCGRNGGTLRVSRATSKTRRSRWVPVPSHVFDAVVSLVPREDRDLDAQAFDGFKADAFRTSLGRACRAAGVPSFGPHALRHRRATLAHLGGVPAASAAAWLGHSAQEHLKTYAHASLSDRSEVDYTPFLPSVSAR